MIINSIFDENLIANESLCIDMTRDGCMAPQSREFSRFAKQRTLPLASPTAHLSHEDVMADVIRSAKSGSDWTRSDLDSYHITIHQVDHLLFFGLQVSRGSSAFVIGKT